jgi:hypothetical protein
MENLNLGHYDGELLKAMTQRLVVDPAMGPLASGLHLPDFRDAPAPASAPR